MIEKIYKQFLSSTGICTDTRQVEHGNMYFALKGERFDGNMFAKDALNAGAICCVIDDENYNDHSERYILVEDSLQALQALASYHRQQLNVPVIAITGSNGKTTTKELLNVALSTKYNVLATAGNFNNHIGVPLTLLRATAKHELLIIEMGANHVEEIAQLCEIARPDVGLITNIGKAHLEGFGGFQGVIKAKSEMYHFLKDTGGHIVYNLEDPLLQNLVGAYEPSLTFAPSLDIKIESSYPSLTFKMHGETYQTNLVGAYNINNVLVAFTVGKLFQCDDKSILRAIEGYIPSNNRSQKMTIGHLNFIMDAYNANPTSMQLSIEEFANADFRRKYLLLGDMLELGEAEISEHREVLDLVSQYDWMEVLLIGPVFGGLKSDYPQFRFIATMDEATSQISSFAKDSYVLVKGSRGLRLEKIIENIK